MTEQEFECHIRQNLHKLPKLMSTIVNQLCTIEMVKSKFRDDIITALTKMPVDKEIK